MVEGIVDTVSCNLKTDKEPNLNSLPHFPRILNMDEFIIDDFAVRRVNSDKSSLIARPAWELLSSEALPETY